MGVMVIHDGIKFWLRADANVYSPQTACSARRVLVSFKAAWSKHVIRTFRGARVNLDISLWKWEDLQFERCLRIIACLAQSPEVRWTKDLNKGRLVCIDPRHRR